MTPRRAARIAEKYGVRFRIGYVVARAARARGLGFPTAFALIEQESNFRHIFGHDSGGLYPGQYVTRRRYRRLLRHVKRGGVANGVGLTQITYPGYLLEHPGLWRKGRNCRFGFGLVNEYARKYGLERGLAIYNGGPANPQFDYADSVLELRDKWRRRFASR